MAQASLESIEEQIRNAENELGGLTSGGGSRARINRLKVDLIRLENKRNELMAEADREARAYISEVTSELQSLASEAAETKAQVDKIVQVATRFQQDWHESVASGNPGGKTNSLCDRLIGFQIRAEDMEPVLTDLCNRVSHFMGDLQDPEIPEDIFMFGEHLSASVEQYKSKVSKALLAVQAIQNEVDQCIAERVDIGKFECPICLMEFSNEDVFTIIACGHSMCRGCAQATVTNDLNTGNLPLVCPQCKASPCERCPTNSGQAHSSSDPGACQIQELELEIILSDQELGRYRRAMLMTLVNGTEGGFVRCPKDGCSNIMWKEHEDSRCFCHACGHEWCDNCNVEWHQDSTCEQYQAWKGENEKADEEMEKLRASGKVKECPHCKNWGVRGGGECNATMCLHCKGKFCWLCGKDLNYLGDPHAHFAENGACYGKLFHGVHD